MAVQLTNRLPRTGLTKLAAADPELRAKESFEITTKIAYQNGALRGTPKRQRRECREVTGATVPADRLCPNREKHCGPPDGALSLSAGGFLTADLELNFPANQI